MFISASLAGYGRFQGWSPQPVSRQAASNSMALQHCTGNGSMMCVIWGASDNMRGHYNDQCLAIHSLAALHAAGIFR